MSKMKIAIPLHGKMSSRVFHQPLFRERLKSSGFEPFFFLSPQYFRAFEFDPDRYFELNTGDYDEYYSQHAFLQQLRLLRRFVVVTETTDLRFRETVEEKLFHSRAWGVAATLIYIDVLRRIPKLGWLLSVVERNLYVPNVHRPQLREIGVGCVLTPGMGYYGFWNEGNFALEAKRLGLPVFSAVTNYDAIVNKGYPGFLPSCLAVWSRQMADEAMKLFGLPARKIEVTGPIQYDRFLLPLPMSRESFLRSIGLDPRLKTIFFAGGVNVTRYFEMYNFLVERTETVRRDEFNVVIRPYPHAKLLVSPGWKVLEKLFREQGVYISHPGSIDAEDRSNEYKQDLWLDDSVDELSYLLRYSDVMVNYFSTISLEAAICDLPVIHLGYDDYSFGHRYGITSEFQQRQTHNRRKLRLAASKVARNEGELIAFVDRYLSDRTLDRDRRREYAVSECGELDGNAGSRVVEMIRSRL
ncbi:MAG: hypothetical protein DYG86_03340 [Chloroflexi bacterium CFX2]|nr:hypothetical protein [Chloroflexi bacterium CFX2]